MSRRQTKESKLTLQFHILWNLNEHILKFSRNLSCEILYCIQVAPPCAVGCKFQCIVAEVRQCRINIYVRIRGHNGGMRTFPASAAVRCPLDYRASRSFVVTKDLQPTMVEW